VDTPPRWRDGFDVPKSTFFARARRTIRRQLFSQSGLVAAAFFLVLLMRGIWVGDVRWPRSGTNLLTVDGFNGGARNVALSPDGERVAFGRVTGEVAVYAIDGRLLHSFAAHPDQIFGIAWSPDGRLLASTGADGTLKVWEAASGQLVTALVGAAMADWWAGLTFHPDGTRLIVKSDGSMVVWDLKTAQPVRTFHREGQKALWAALSPDGQRLAVVWSNNALSVLDLPTGQEVLTIADSGLLNRVVYSPDGRRLATGGWDGRVKLWDAATGEELMAFAGQDRGGPLAFSPDSRHLVTGTGQYKLTVMVWDTATGQLLDARSRPNGVRTKFDLPPFTRNVGAIYGVAFHDGGLRVASTKDQRVADVWEAATDEDFWLTIWADAGALFRYLLYSAVVLVAAVALTRSRRVAHPIT
jgi:WD40 repeat protein